MPKITNIEVHLYENKIPKTVNARNYAAAVRTVLKNEYKNVTIDVKLHMGVAEVFDKTTVENAAGYDDETAEMVDMFCEECLAAM